METAVPVQKKPRKKRAAKPSERMKKAAVLLVEKGWTMTKGQIMKEAWYSPAIQTVPHKVTESPTFKALIDKYIPEDALAAKHKELLEARDTFSREFDAEMSDDDIIALSEPHRIVRIYRDRVSAKNPIPHTVAYMVATDRKTASDALDKAYKVKWSYAPAKVETTTLDLTQLLEAALKGG